MAGTTNLKGSTFLRNTREKIGQEKVWVLLGLLVLAGHSAQLEGAYAGRESAFLASGATRSTAQSTARSTAQSTDGHLVSRLAGHLGDARLVTAGLGIKTAEVSSFILRSYDAHTGSLVAEDEFDLTVDEDSAAAIAAGAGRVYAVGSGVNPDGRLSLLVRAYDAKTGQLLWEDDLNPRSSAESEGTATRTAGQRRFPAEKTDSRASTMYQPSFTVQAVNARTGEIVWQDEFLASKPTGQDWTGRLPSGSPPLFERSFSILIRTYDTDTGSLLWQDEFYPIQISGDAI